MDFIEWLLSLGYIGIMLGLMLEVIPSEIVLAYGGFMVAKGDITFSGAVFFGVLGCIIAQLFLYWLGLYGGRPFVVKYGKYLLLKEKYLDISERWFEKYGSIVVFAARFVPVIRQAISIPAGLAKMNVFKFIILTAAASFFWCIFFIYMGSQLGHRWQDIYEVSAPYIRPISIFILSLGLVYFIYKMLWRKNK